MYLSHITVDKLISPKELNGFELTSHGGKKNYLITHNDHM